MKKIFVVGAGTMGAGIAQTFAQSKAMEVWLCDQKEEFVQSGLAKLKKGLDYLLNNEKITSEEYDAILRNVHTTTDYQDAANADLVVEAIFENMEAKRDVFTKLDKICSGKTIFASNTSSLPVTEIAAGLDHAGNFIGMHFFNPAPVMKLVEVVKCFFTSDETQDRVMDIAREIGKDPVSVKEGPGFVVNRILIPMINEACEILREGIATAEDIDKAMCLGANHSMGPLRTADLVGNDINLYIMETLFEETADPKYRPSILLKQMVRANQLGRKTGKGFFEYPEKK
ncbi:MAG: 3-hydroxyacyl-CoA dehydrogenase family protein [Fastidiosipilaceae bacterium]|jgi:3-hydroxybutyryl-CoA dehydrogenase